MSHRIQYRRDTKSHWEEINPILMEGEVGYEIDTHHQKIGDGVHAWNDLEYEIGIGNIAQDMGDSENLAMSQKAVKRIYDLLNTAKVGAIDTGRLILSLADNLIYKIKYLMHDNDGTEEKFYPLTHVKAVIDDDNEDLTSYFLGYQYIGHATLSSQPLFSKKKIFYLASTAGVYTKFGNIELEENEIAFLKWNGTTWSKESICINAPMPVGITELEKESMEEDGTWEEFLENNPLVYVYEEE